MLLLLATQALALQQQLDRPALCAISDRAAVVTITSIQADWSSLHTIDRTVVAEVLQPVKGSVGKTLTFTLRGGAIGEQVHWVEDQPHLRTGATYVLLLDRPGTHANITGGDQGAIRVTAPNAAKGERLEQALTSLGSCDAS